MNLTRLVLWSLFKTNNKSSIAKVMALTTELDVAVEHGDMVVKDRKDEDREAIIKRILAFKTTGPLSFGDHPAEWERNEREDRDLKFQA